MTKLRTRRVRRQAKMKLKGKFKVGHKSVAGRTGNVFAKRLQGRRIEKEKRV
jgi:hypothetical protein